MSDNDPVCEHNEKERVCFYCYTKRLDRMIAALRDEVRVWREGKPQTKIACDDEQWINLDVEQAIATALACTYRRSAVIKYAPAASVALEDK